MTSDRHGPRPASVCLLAGLAALGIVAGAGRSVVAQEPAVAAGNVVLVAVVNDGCSETDLSLAQLRRIYLGEDRFWRSGTPIHGLLPPKDEPELAAAFVRRVMGMTPDEFARRWQSNHFRGLSTRTPRSLSTVSVTLRALLRSEIPIALVRSDRLPERELGLRVLTIDGKRPGEPGYPLQFDAPGRS